MVLEAAQDKNITFRVRGRGNVNFIGGTSGSSSSSSSSSSGIMIGGQSRLEQRLTRLETSVDGSDGIADRLRQMEERITQLTVRRSYYHVIQK